MIFANDKEKESYFTRIYDENYRLAVAHAYKIHKNTERAKETVNDAFLKIWRLLDSIDNPDKIKAYIITAVKHTALNNEEKYQSKESRDISREALYNELDEDINTPVPDTEAEITEGILYILTRINELDEKYSVVLILNLYNELSPEEISKFLDCPVKTVYTRLDRGKKLLKKLLNEERSRF